MKNSLDQFLPRKRYRLICSLSPKSCLPDSALDRLLLKKPGGLHKLFLLCALLYQRPDDGVLVSQSCPTLCNSMDCSSLASSVHGIFQARKYWSGLPFPSPGDFLNPRIEPVSPALAGGFFTTEPPGKPCFNFRSCILSQHYALHCSLSSSSVASLLSISKDFNSQCC